MNRPDISLVLRERVVVADGATGTVLDAMLGDAAAGRRDMVPLERPEAIRAVHAAYLEAGAELIKTATFNGSARGLARFAVATRGRTGAVGSAGDLARTLNRAAARLARAAADAAEAADGRPRWVAGSIGPGSDAPSLGASSYAELRASYLPQALGLAEGGVDLYLIETVQDPLQCKAAIGAIMDARAAAGRNLPFVASATVDARGRMLSGASPDAFAAIVEPFGPAAIGLNCSGGPEELGRALASLAAACSAPLSFMPNAGMPVVSGGVASWPLEPAGFAEATSRIAREHGVALVGGCCGTGPGHIKPLADAMRDRAVPPRPARVFALASATRAFRRDGALFVVDERANAAGSAAFRAFVRAGDLDGAAGYVMDRGTAAESGAASAVDVCVASPGRDETADLAAVVARVAPTMGAALSVDSVDPGAIAAALPLIGGRPLVNSVNLEDEVRARKAFAAARDYGAAVVCLALDADGPARTAERKLDVCRRLYAMALETGLQPEDILFDVCTFPAATGDPSLAGSAAATLAAVAGLTELCPRSLAVLGVGNVSYGLPKRLRPSFTARFLRRAMDAGLSAAIVDPAVTRSVPDAAFSSAVDEVLDGRDGALDRFLEAYGGEAAAPAVSGLMPAVDAPSDARSPDDPLGAVAAAVARGDAAGTATAVRAVVGDAAGADAPGVVELAAVLAEAMAAVGRRYDAGELALPRVLRSADAARAGFSALGSQRGDGPVVVLATVRGDLHDIGKNLVAMVLQAAGFGVRDLGTDRDAGDIAAAADGALAVGVSGLLTRSLAEMAAVAGALAARGSKALLLCGGAAVDPGFIAREVEPLRPGLAVYGADPFKAVELLRAFQERRG